MEGDTRKSQESGEGGKKEWVRNGLMSGHTVSTQGSISWCPSESLGTTHFRVAPARGKRAGCLSTSSRLSLIEGCSWGLCLLDTSVLLCVPELSRAYFWSQKKPSDREQQVLVVKITVCVGTPTETVGELQGGLGNLYCRWAAGAERLKEIDQLVADEWLSPRAEFLENSVADQMFS